MYRPPPRQFRPSRPPRKSWQSRYLACPVSSTQDTAPRSQQLLLYLPFLASSKAPFTLQPVEVIVTRSSPVRFVSHNPSVLFDRCAHCPIRHTPHHPPRSIIKSSSSTKPLALPFAANSCRLNSSLAVPPARLSTSGPTETLESHQLPRLPHLC